MTNKDEKNEELKKEIVLARLRETPPNVKVSFGNRGGEFLSTGDLIKEIKNETEIGKKVIEIQFAYLKALKRGFLEKKH